MDIGSLHDDELRQQLLEYGVNVGPIVSTTRLFYEKKLGKLLESGGVQQPSEPEESEEDEEEEAEEDEEVQINYRQPEPKPSKPVAEKVPVIKPQFTSTPIAQSDYTPIIKARTATPTQAIRRNTGRTEGRKETSTAPTQEEKQGGGGFSMMLKLLFVAILVFLVYLVIINMNPSADQLPLSFEGEV